jgi:hypothetical protein
MPPSQSRPRRPCGFKPLFCAVALCLAGQAGQAQNVYTYVGPTGTTLGSTGNLWSNDANWSSSTGATYPSTSTDTGDLNSTTSARAVVYDSGSSGALGTLNIAESGGVLNELDVERNLTVANAITLGATSGTSEILLDNYTPTADINLTTTGGLTINSGGVLEFQPSSNSADETGTVTGNVTLAGGTITGDRGENTLNAGQYTITGSLTMTAGIINLGATPPLGTGSVNDNRLYVDGNFQATGGAINSSLATAGYTSLYLEGATNYLAGTTTFNSYSSITLIAATATTQSLYSLPALNIVLARWTNAASETTIVGAGNTAGTVNASGTLTTGSLQLRVSNSSASNSSSNPYTFQLGSNITESSGSMQPLDTTLTGNGSPSIQIDVNGKTLDLTAISTNNTAGSTDDDGGIFAPNNTSLGGYQTGATSVTFNLIDSSNTGGTIKALGFDLSSGAGSNVKNNIILQSTGGAGTANNLSNSSSTGATTAGTIAATSTFLYSGSATSASPATLTSNRAIGILQVTNGALNLNQAALTAAGGASVTSGGTLEFNGGATLGTLTLGTGTNFTASSATLAFYLGTTGTAGTYDQILGNGATASGGAFSITGSTLALSGTIVYADTYNLLADFSSGTVSGVTITGYDSTDYTASLSSAGNLSFAAVPEPSAAWALVLGWPVLLVFRRFSEASGKPS